MTAFRICLAAPPAYPHAACFAELARLLWLSLRDLGRDCDFKVHEPAPDRLNIILGYHLLGGSYVPILVMILPPGAFLTYGTLTAVVKAVNKRI